VLLRVNPCLPAGRLSPLAVTWDLEFVEEQPPATCPERSRRIMVGSRRVDFVREGMIKFSKNIGKIYAGCQVYSGTFR
jgi:hypothetical protein